MDKMIVALRAVLMGFLTGLIVSVPLGPSGLESIKRTISKGYKQGLAVAIGAVGADTFDLFLLNFGVFNLLSANKKLEAFFWVLSGLLLTFIGYRSIKSSKKDRTGHELKTVKRNIAKQSMPFFTGFFMTFSNPMTHSLWLTLSGTIIRVWYYRGKVPYYIFIFSIVAGMVTWFTLLNLFVLKGHKKINIEHSNKISNLIVWGIFFMGICFIIYGIVRIAVLG